MKNFPSSVEFVWPWRNYQGRVLSELDLHLDDNHLHIIAAPGSGKTVLGLEVVRRHVEKIRRRGLYTQEPRMADKSCSRREQEQCQPPS